jgi:hypothetical protein
MFLFATLGIMDHLHWRHLLAKQSPTATSNTNLGWRDSTYLGHLGQRRHDIQHNDTQHNDTQHKVLIYDTQHYFLNYDTQHNVLILDTQHNGSFTLATFVSKTVRDSNTQHSPWAA